MGLIRTHRFADYNRRAYAEQPTDEPSNNGL